MVTALLECGWTPDSDLGPGEQPQSLLLLTIPCQLLARNLPDVATSLLSTFCQQLGRCVDGNLRYSVCWWEPSVFCVLRWLGNSWCLSSQRAVLLSYFVAIIIACSDSIFQPGWHATWLTRHLAIRPLIVPLLTGTAFPKVQTLLSYLSLELFWNWSVCPRCMKKNSDHVSLMEEDFTQVVESLVVFFFFKF